MSTLDSKKSNTSTPSLDDIRACVQDDLQAIDRLIIDELVSPIPLIREITQHIIKSGGKRLRPLLVILLARACHYQGANEHHELAAIIEFVHTATLLHDDVVDESHLRRGQSTANAIWGNQASVLVGDFLYSRAFQILARRANTPVMKVLANTTNAIAEGEVLQLMNCNEPDITEADYMQVIEWKTAKLFESAAEIGALIATDDTSQHQAAANYGLHLGLAFQIIDDLLDYTADSEQLGKNIGDDLAEGKATLPLIHALHHSAPRHAKVIRHAIEHGGLAHLDTIARAIEETGATSYCLNKANEHIQLASKALQRLPESIYREALQHLLQFVTARTY